MYGIDCVQGSGCFNGRTADSGDVCISLLHNADMKIIQVQQNFVNFGQSLIGFVCELCKVILDTGLIPFEDHRSVF